MVNILWIIELEMFTSASVPISNADPLDAWQGEQLEYPVEFPMIDTFVKLKSPSPKDIKIGYIYIYIYIYILMHNCQQLVVFNSVLN